MDVVLLRSQKKIFVLQEVFYAINGSTVGEWWGVDFVADFGLSRVQRICVRVDLSDGTSAPPPAARVKLNTRTFLLDKAKVKDEKSVEAEGGTDMHY